MLADRRQDRLCYEQALRVIGRHLDAEPAYHLSVLEVDDGFTVRYQIGQHQSGARTVHFTCDRLHDLYVFNSAGRGVNRKQDRHQGIWGKFVNGHQNFFRALGHLLDNDHAQSLTIDELPEGVQISYVRPDVNDPLRWEKIHLDMREHEIHAMLQSAQQRRSRKLTVVQN